MPAISDCRGVIAAMGGRSAAWFDSSRLQRVSAPSSHSIARSSSWQVVILGLGPSDLNSACGGRAALSLNLRSLAHPVQEAHVSAKPSQLHISESLF